MVKNPLIIPQKRSNYDAKDTLALADVRLNYNLKFLFLFVSYLISIVLLVSIRKIHIMLKKVKISI